MARKKPTDGYDGRLRLALERGPMPMSVRAFAGLMGAGGGQARPDLRGTSYGGVRSYVEGRVRNPRMDLLRAMAQELGVRWQWLAHGEGEMTHEEEEARIQSSGLAAVRDREQVLWEQAFEIKAGVSCALLDMDHDGLVQREGKRIIDIPHWVAPAAEVCRRLRINPGQVGEALRAPLAALGVQPADLSHDELSDYIFGMTPVLLSLASHTPTPGEEAS